MKGSEIRQKFLEYFEKNGHKIVHSSPLLPANDPTLLFTNAGMNQFKDVFTGADKRDYNRATSSQKCLRAGGKHNDLDEVGKTARHHTFFEMLGNFSFGDYFKEDAIRFAWDFLTGSKDEGKLGLDPRYLWFTYFEGNAEVPADTEARDLWIKVGAQPERVLPFDAKDNFWQMGDTGPCGPCSEIHYYMGDEPDNPEKNRPEFVNAETGDDTIEIWNLVFMQFERAEDGKGGFTLTPLPAPSVDTGAGLERIAAVLQGEKTNYDTDLIKPIIDKTAEMAERFYEPETQSGFAMRVVADHARATAFAIADGILPGNEGRNYVLRKIMRRAIYHGREHLGFETLFFHKVCDFVIELMSEAFPELEVQRDFIGKMVRLEEERFANTMTVGLKKLNELLAKSDFDPYDKSTPRTNVSLVELAKLYDTYGIPIDLMYVVIKSTSPPISTSNGGNNFWTLERELGLDPSVKSGLYAIEKDNIFFDFSETSATPEIIGEEKFRELIEIELKRLQQTSEIGKTKQADKINPIYTALSRQANIRSNFHGYDKTEVEGAKILALVKADERVDVLDEGEEGLVVLDETPFYAEAGGQVGDTGVLFNTNAQAKVFDTFAPIAGIVLHKSKIERGSLSVGDTVTAAVDVLKRDATRRNHTATHLVHAALKEVLGTHVKQAGSVVAPQFLRFDFTHYQPISQAESKEIEDLVNRYILENHPVTTDIMAIEEAMRSGAVALFGEKYGSAVRVLSVGGGEFSRELCGGTHVRATGDIGSFKIISDEAIASGVRRIRAITGFDAFERFREDERLIAESLGALKTQRDNLPAAIEKLQEELKRTRKEVDELKMKIATGAFRDSSANGDEAKDVSGVKVIAKIVEGLDKGGMRHLSDTLMSKIKSGVVVLGRSEEDKVSFIVRVSDDLTGKIKAGKIVQEIAPIVGGRGGGKPDMAEGGGTDASKLPEALEASYKSIEQMLG
ncbi:MAG TPA: alanine--tRNA ligase [Pyrinomonadaceae bacterium]|jgi:alanyl-tRNA synthetase